MSDDLLGPAELRELADRMQRLAAGATQGEDPDLYDDRGWSVDTDRGCLEPDEPFEPLVRSCDGEVLGSFLREEDARLAALFDPHLVRALALVLRRAADVRPQYRVTFGVQYARDPHPAGSWVHPDGWLTIVADDPKTARELAMGLLGRHWAFMYAMPQTGAAPAGAIEDGSLVDWARHFPREELLRVEPPHGDR